MFGIALRLFVAYTIGDMMIKKIYVNLFKLIFPAALICSLLFLLRGGKNVIEGIYIMFPLIFIYQGIFCSKNLILLAIGLVFSEASFLVFVNRLYHMGSCVDLAIIYALICLAAYLVKTLIIKRKKKI